MKQLVEYLLSNSQKNAICEEPEIGTIAYDQFGDEWLIEDFCSIIDEKEKLEHILKKYDESYYFESWLEDEFDETNWKKDYNVDDIYAVAVSKPEKSSKRNSSMKRAVYIWSPDDLWYKKH